MSHTGPATLAFTIGARTDRGLQRNANEDAFALLDLPGADAAFVVADGMGGLRAGDVASNEAVRVIGATLAEGFDAAGGSIRDALGDALARANDAVYALTEGLRREQDAAAADAPTQKPGAEAGGAGAAVMGTTAVVGVVRSGVLHLAYAGDSRAYLLRDGTLYPLTEDHSFVAERVRAGDMSAAEARTSRFRNMITRAVGIDVQIQPDFVEEALQPGDVVLACSDGLTTMLDDSEIGELLTSPGLVRATPDRTAAALVDAANRKGGSDNVTVVVVRAGGADDANGTRTMPVASSRRDPPRSAAATPARAGAASAPRRVIDIDEKRRGAALPLVLLAGVGLAALGFAGALAGSSPLRRQIGQALVGRPVAPLAPAGTVSIKPLRDYAALTYGPPATFSRREFITRGDLLAYSPNAGVFTVRDTTGDLLYLSRGGDPLRSVATLDVAPPGPDPAPPSRVFLATDLQGNIYLSYTSRKVIEKRSPEGQLLAKLTGFQRPEAITVDEQGNIFVIDRNILKVLRAKDRTATPTPAATSGAKPVSKPS